MVVSCGLVRVSRFDCFVLSLFYVAVGCLVWSFVCGNVFGFVPRVLSFSVGSDVALSVLFCLFVGVSVFVARWCVVVVEPDRVCRRGLSVGCLI